ncbi:hypothetical protein DYY67_2238 [Candidatus Nitrosotalea sp. TS]|nr:hypothetical protein [Candidatus Nitrosotalea sp. TS]
MIPIYLVPFCRKSKTQKTFGLYKPIPVEVKVGLFLGLLSRISPALPKTRANYST